MKISTDTNVLLEKLKSLQNRDAINDDELFNKLFPYETMISSNIKPSRRNNMIQQSSRSLESDAPSSSNKIREMADNDPIVREVETTLVKKNGQDEVLIDLASEKPVVSPSIEKQQPGAKAVVERPSLSKSSIDLNKAKSIAYNSREVRLMGPEGKEVEMKDDLATKVAVVFDNLRSETSQFLGEVNDKLDKGWTEFKQSVDKLVEQGKKQVSQL